MEQKNPLWTIRSWGMLGLTLGAWVCLNPVYGQPQVELILEQNPAHGGMIDPGTGVHQFASNSQVALTAVPKDGYRFAYWLGDVSNPASRTTHIRLNDSKAVVAVFEATSLRGTEQEEATYVTGGGAGTGGGLVSTASNFFAIGFSAPGGSSPSDPAEVATPAPVPEPATVVLLGLGGLSLSLKKGRKISAENPSK